MRPDIWLLYRQMIRSRLFEERVKELWEKGLISGEMHLGMGEEAIAACLTSMLQDGDAMALDYRGTPPLIMRGVKLVCLLREFMGQADGLCRGYGGHMHLFSQEHLCASSGIVGASGPLASGFALASQLLRPGKLAVAFFGEGAMNQGMLLESLNLAAAWKLPVIFVCKDNRIAITTPSPSVTAGSLMERVKGFGLHFLEVDGTDIEAVWEAAAEAVQRVRKGEGPVFLLAHCCHLEGHFLGDPLLRIIRNPFKQVKKTLMPLIRSLLSPKGASLGDRFRSLRDIASLIGRASKEKRSKFSDPIYQTRQKLKMDKRRLEEMEKEVRQEIDQAIELSLAGFGSDSEDYDGSSNLS